MKLFVDSSAFIALTDKDDQYYRKAVDFAHDDSDSISFVTSNFVLGETISRLNSRIGPDAAFAFGERMLQSSIYEVIDIDRPLFQEALKLLHKFQDKKLSFTDLTSFAVMRLQNIKEAFTFDEDFTKVGFRAVPGIK